MSERPLTDRQLACLRAIKALHDDGVRLPDAQDVAARTRLSQGIRRANGAVKGAWSGYTSPAFHVGRTLRSLVDRRLLGVIGGYRSRGSYYLTDAGEKATADNAVIMRLDKESNSRRV